jgi:hypothetical protein
MAHITPDELDRIRRRARRAAGQTSLTEPPTRPLSMVPMPRGGTRAGAHVWRGSGSRIGWLFPVAAVVVLALLFSEQLNLNQRLGMSTSGYMTETTTLAVDSTAWAEMVWAETFNDSLRLAELRETGSILTLERGTPVHIVAVGLATRKVRPMNGAYTGRTGWVAARAIESR